MQAAKIVVNGIYAYKHPTNGGMIRLKAERVITERYGNNNLVVSYVKGTAFEAIDDHGQIIDGEEVRVEVKDILGSYEEHRALVEKANAEKATREKLERDKELMLKRSAAVLSRMLSVPVRDNRKRFTSDSKGIKICYHTVEIDLEVLDKVLALGERLGITVSDEELEKLAA